MTGPATTLATEPASSMRGLFQTSTATAGSTLLTWWRPVSIAREALADGGGGLSASTTTYDRRGQVTASSTSEVGAGVLRSTHDAGDLFPTSAAGPDAAWTTAVAYGPNGRGKNVVVDGTVVGSPVTG